MTQSGATFRDRLPILEERRATPRMSAP
jgi:hypothetical protein